MVCSVPIGARVRECTFGPGLIKREIMRIVCILDRTCTRLASDAPRSLRDSLVCTRRMRGVRLWFLSAGVRECTFGPGLVKRENMRIVSAIDRICARDSSDAPRSRRGSLVGT